MASGIRNLNVNLSLRLDGWNKALNQANRDLTRFAKQAEDAGRAMSMAFTLPAVGLGASAISAFAEMDKLRKSLTAVAGSSEEAEAQLSRLRTLALEPGLDLEQAAKATIRLQSVGYAASEAERTILQMSKAVTLAGGTADDLDEVVRQMTQMIGRGSILREDWNVIAERVPAINIALQDAFGTTNIEAIRESGISVKEFNDAIVEAISRNEKFQSVQGGVANAITNFQSSLRQALATLGEAIDKNVNIAAVMDKLAGFVNRVAEGFANLDPRLQTAILATAAFLAVVGPTLVLIGSFARLLPTITLGVKALTAALGALLSPIGLTVAAVALITAGMVKAYKENEVFRQTVQQLGAAVGRLFAVIKERFDIVFASIGRLIGGTEKFAGTWRTMFAVFSGIVNNIVRQLTNLVKVFSGVISAINNAIKGEFRAAAGDLGDAFMSFIDNLNPKRIAEDFMSAYKATIEAEPPARIKPPVVATAAAAPSAVTGGTITTSATTDTATPSVPITNDDITKLTTISIASQAAAASAANLAKSFDEAKEKIRLAMKASMEAAEEMTFLDEVVIGLKTIYDTTLDSMVMLAEQGKLTMASFAESVAGSVRKIIGMLIKQGVVAAVTSALESPLIKINPALIPVIAAGAGALAQTAFNKVLSSIKVPALAQGGLAYGPTMALVGDNPGARSNPEVIAPLSKLQSIMADAGGGMAIGEFTLRGEDLLLSVQRTENRQRRYK